MAGPWLFCMSPDKGNAFRLSDGTSLPTTVDNLFALIESGRIEEDYPWSIDNNGDQIDPEDEMFVYSSGSKGLGIIAVATIASKEKLNGKWHIYPAFDLEKSRALLNAPIEPDFIQQRIKPLNPNVRSLAPIADELTTRLPWNADLPQRHLSASNREGAARDPMMVPMIFLRIGWMERYRGQTVADQIVGGGAFVVEHGYGHEMFNFQPCDEHVFGYVQPPGTAYNGELGAGININRLGASSKDDSISGVIAVWVATSPQGGSFIVGWYKNATIYRHWQAPPPEANRRYKEEEFGYYVSAASSDATLLSPDERIFQVPRGEGGIGQANVWYADSPDAHRQFRSNVLRYLDARQLQEQPPGPKNGSPKQPDPLLRQKVEQAAVLATTAYYEALGYDVDSVEADNFGWDLNAVHAARRLSLKLEVKGLSGTECCVELTPNEYDKLKKHRESYRVCVVTQALSTPGLAIFSFSEESQRWEDQHGRLLQFEDIIAAKCRAV